MWYYVENGQQAGPVSNEQLAELYQQGRINDDTLVWQAGQKDWLPYREFKNSTATSGTAAGAQTDEVVCAECGKIFPASETIRHGNVNVCAECKPIFLQKLAEGARIETGSLNLAGIGTRFAAVFIDGILLFVVNMVVNVIGGLSMGQAVGVEPKTAALAAQLVLMAINIAIGLSYETVMIGKYGATLGKMACKIKVVTADGGKVSYARSLGRYFAKMLSGMICAIGYIMAFFDKEKRALHDHICNTRVVMK